MKTLYFILAFSFLFCACAKENNIRVKRDKSQILKTLPVEEKINF